MGHGGRRPPLLEYGSSLPPGQASLLASVVLRGGGSAPPGRLEGEWQRDEEFQAGAGSGRRDAQAAAEVAGAPVQAGQAAAGGGPRRNADAVIAESDGEGMGGFRTFRFAAKRHFQLTLQD